MVVQDVLGVLLVVAEARGRAWLAGAADAAGDVARLASVGISLDAVLRWGLSVDSVIVVASVAATSFVTTAAVTAWSRRIR